MGRKQRLDYLRNLARMHQRQTNTGTCRRAAPTHAELHATVDTHLIQARDAKETVGRAQVIFEHTVSEG